MLVRYLKLPFVAVVGALALAACDDAGSPIDSGGTSRLTIQITDAPADLVEANVKVQKIVLIRSESGEGEGNDRVELTPKSTDWINLLTLSNGKVQDLVTETVEAGAYQQVRLVVCEMYIKTKAGEVIAASGTTLPGGVTATSGTELKLTSQCKSGFKVNLPSEGLPLDGGTNTLVIDFDVQRSFVHQAGKSGKWIVTPVLHGVRKDREGTIAGTVALQNVTLPVTCGGESLTQTALLQRFVPTATAGTSVRSGSTKGDGTFSISHMAPGTYTLASDTAVFANSDKLSFTAVATPASVSVTAGSNATSNFVVSAVTCTPA